MFERKTIDFIWLSMMGLTLLSATLAESADSGLIVTLIISLTIAFKGRMIVDRFMELATANRYLRNAMRLYFWVIPGLIVFVYLFPDVLVRMTTLQ